MTLRHGVQSFHDDSLRVVGRRSGGVGSTQNECGRRNDSSSLRSQIFSPFPLLRTPATQAINVTVVPPAWLKFTEDFGKTIIRTKSPSIAVN